MYKENLQKIDFDDLEKRLAKMWSGKGFSEAQIRTHVNTLKTRVSKLIDILENQGLGDIIGSEFRLSYQARQGR